MSNNLKIEQPAYYYRNFEKEINIEESSGYGKRIFLAAMPFISLYRPAGKLLSLSMDTLRVWSSVGGFRDSLSQGNLYDIAGSSVQIGVAVIALSATIISLPCGLLVTTGYDVCFYSMKSVKAIVACDSNEFFENFGYLANSGLYLVMLSTNSLAISIFSLTLQVAIEGYKSYREYQEDGHNIEFIGHLLMTCVRVMQLTSQCNKLKIDNIQVNNAKLENEEIESQITQSKEEYMSKLSDILHEGDLTAFKEIKQSQEWNNLTNDDLGQLSKVVVTRLNVCAKEKHQTYLTLFEAVNFEHPNRIFSFDSIKDHLFEACRLGNVDFFEYLVTKPIVSANLKDTDILAFIREAHHSISPIELETSRFQPELEINKGKAQILMVSLRLPQWNYHSVEFIEQMMLILVRYGSIPVESREYAIKSFENCAAWGNLQRENISRILSSQAISFMNTDNSKMSDLSFRLLNSHPAWKDLTRNDLSQIAERIATTQVNGFLRKERLARINAFRLLVEHEKWKEISLLELLKIAHSDLLRLGRGELFTMLSSHPQWNQMTQEDYQNLIFDFYHGSRGYNHKASSILIEHPWWSKMSVSQIAELGEMAANRSNIELFKTLSSHPNWNQLTKKDILEVLEWSYWIENIADIIREFSKLDAWKEITRDELKRYKLEKWVC